MEEKPEPEPEYWTYELIGGPCDGHQGRAVQPRVAVHRPSTVDHGKIHVYMLAQADGEQRYALYRYSYDGYAALATEQDL